MPHVIIKTVVGKTNEEKQVLAAAVSNALMASLGYDDESISISIEDVLAEDWLQNVYLPDIQGKADRIYKKPGYDPFE